MERKTFIVTGGNTGIGKAIAAELAKQGQNVVITSRNEEKGLTALNDIKKISGSCNIGLVLADLSTTEGCRQLASTLLEKYPDMKILINNAGIWKTQMELNSEGLEMTFMVNHMAPFILSNLLFERLKMNGPARIVNVNAGLYFKGKLDIEKTPYGKDFSKFGTYANTKLCGVLTTAEMARRTEGSGVTVNAIHPGVIKTGLGSTRGVFGLILRAAKQFWGTPEEGAKAPVWLATDPALQSVTGKFFMLTKDTELTEAARDRNLACKLWDLSAKLSGI